MRRIFAEEKPEQHQTASNAKCENSFLFLPKSENQKRNRTETTNRNVTKKRTFRALALSPERIEKFWGVVGLFGSVEELCHWWKYGDMN